MGAAAEMEEKEMKGYKLGWKVVRVGRGFSERGNGTYFSAFGPGIVPAEARTRYKFFKPTFPKDGCGPLCVFKKRIDAEDFLNGYRKIFPCAYVPSYSKYVWVGDTKTPRTKLTNGKALASEVILLKERTK